MDKYKKLNIALAVISVISFGVFLLIRSNCLGLNCSLITMDYYLDPAINISFVLVIHFGLLLLIPHHYFENWLKWVFSWLFPLYVILIFMTGDTTGGFFVSFSFALMAELLGYIFGGISLAFVIVRFIVIHQFKRNLK